MLLTLNVGIAFIQFCEEQLTPKHAPNVIITDTHPHTPHARIIGTEIVFSVAHLIQKN